MGIENFPKRSGKSFIVRNQGVRRIHAQDPYTILSGLNNRRLPGIWLASDLVLHGLRDLPSVRVMRARCSSLPAIAGARLAVHGAERKTDGEPQSRTKPPPCRKGRCVRKPLGTPYETTTAVKRIGREARSALRAELSDESAHPARLVCATAENGLEVALPKPRWTGATGPRSWSSATRCHTGPS